MKKLIVHYQMYGRLNVNMLSAEVACGMGAYLCPRTRRKAKVTCGNCKRTEMFKKSLKRPKSK